MPFEDVNWGVEQISDAKLNKMTANDRWLYEHAIQGYYDVYGIKRETGLAIRTGYVKAYATENASLISDHYFPKPFLPGARPVVVISFCSATSLNIVVATRGLDGRAVPDHRGFSTQFTQLRAPGEPTKFTGNDMWAGYVAISSSG